MATRATLDVIEYRTSIQSSSSMGPPVLVLAVQSANEVVPFCYQYHIFLQNPKLADKMNSLLRSECHANFWGNISISFVSVQVLVRLNADPMAYSARESFTGAGIIYDGSSQQLLQLPR